MYSKLISTDALSARSEINESFPRVEGQEPICENCAASEEGRTADLNTESRGRSGAAASLPGGSSKPGSANVYHRPSAKVLALLHNLKKEQEASKGRRKPRKRFVLTSGADDLYTADWPQCGIQLLGENARPN